MPKAKFTALWVQRVKAPERGQVDHWDQLTKGLTLRVSSSGRKTWNVHYRFHRRKRRLSLGTFPSISLAEARTRALTALAQASANIDPAAEKQKASGARTFAELATSYLQKHARPKKKSFRGDEWMINRHLLPRWKNVKAADISRSDVRALVESIAERGAPILANRVLALVSKIFSFAVGRDWRAENPCVGIERPGVEHRRERLLSDDEIQKVWNALEHEDIFHRALFQMRFLTAARGGEIRRMRWIDVDLDTKWWIVPREHSKNNEPHRVPLTDPAHEILTELRRWQEQRIVEINAGRQKKGWELKEMSAWIFPSPKGNRPFEWEQRAAKRLRKNSGVDFRPHDIRRTVATALTEHCHVDRFILKRILNHVDRDVTGVYDRNKYDTQKRAALESWARRLQWIVEDRDTGTNVIPIAAGKK